jgi:two-component system sensor kinase FixL
MEARNASRDSSRVAPAFASSERPGLPGLGARGHVTRSTTLGELASSLAHELNQPLAAVVTNGKACLRWLSREQPDLEEAIGAVQRMIRDTTWTADVIAHTRALLRKSDGEKVRLDITAVIRELLVLIHQELRRHQIVIEESFAEDLPPSWATGSSSGRWCST